jgi:glycosyltransferase involved in cell wall biosynthesis
MGISTFYALTGIFLKRLGFVKRTVYYSIDYYPAHSLMNQLFRKVDRVCAENSDMVWNLSPAISKARHGNNGRHSKRSMEILVPLTYSSKLLTFRPFSEIEKWSIAFVGTIVRSQGLQLLIEAMPEILKHLPNVTVNVIGDGPYASELKRLVKESGLGKHFIFYGFIKDELKVIDILSRCSIGVAPFIPVPENNAMTADPGKPKFYTFLGLPVVITKIPSGILINEKEAGIAINYDPREFANAVIKLLEDDQTLAKYRQNANLFAQSFTSERVFGIALKTTLKHFQNNIKQEN